MSDERHTQEERPQATNERSTWPDVPDPEPGEIRPGSQDEPGSWTQVNNGNRAAV